MKTINILALLCGGLLFFPSMAGGAGLEVVTTFDAGKLETPESLVVDPFGNVFVSLALTGEIRKIDPHGHQSLHAQLPLGDPLTECGPFINIMGALADDSRGNLYVTVNSCDPAARGVYQVTPEGVPSLVASFPPAALLNGITYLRGNLYVADSALGVVWRVSASGGSPEVWSDDPLLEFVENDVGAPGPNGIQFFHGQFYAVNSSTFQIISIPILHDGTAGTASVFANAVCDDFSVDVKGALYCATDPFNTVIKIFPDGSSEVLYTLDDGLDGPTATAFGKRGDNRTLYITNAAFPFLPNNMSPSLMKVGLKTPGYPLR